jgi:hypothetical protein
MLPRVIPAIIVALAMVAPVAAEPLDRVQLAQAAGAGGRALQAGVAGAVRGLVQQASLAVPAAVGRNVVSGDAIYLGDRITTGGDAGLQVMLMDQTVFQIGPGAALTIDEFVYNPETNAGKVSATIAKGAFRFVTGKIAQREPTAMTVNLPVATIGIRGTIVAGITDGTSATVILVGPGPDSNTGERVGRVLVSSAGTQVEISRPGFATTIQGVNVAPQAPARATSAQINQVNQSLSSSGQRAQAGQPSPPQQQASQPQGQQQGQQQQGQQQQGQQQQGQQQGQQQQGQQQQGQQQQGQTSQPQQTVAGGTGTASSTPAAQIQPAQSQPTQVQATQPGATQPGATQTQTTQSQSTERVSAQAAPTQSSSGQSTQSAATTSAGTVTVGQATAAPAASSAGASAGLSGAGVAGGSASGGGSLAASGLRSTSASSIAGTAGQTVGNAGGNLQNLQGLQTLQTAALNRTTQVAQQEQSVRAGVANFEDLRRITTGVANYSLSNVALTGDGSGSYNFTARIDFGSAIASYRLDGNYTLAGRSGSFTAGVGEKNYRTENGAAVTTDHLRISGGPAIGQPGFHTGQIDLSINNGQGRIAEFVRTRVAVTNGSQSISGAADARRQ